MPPRPRSRPRVRSQTDRQSTTAPREEQGPPPPGGQAPPPPGRQAPPGGQRPPERGQSPAREGAQPPGREGAQPPAREGEQAPERGAQRDAGAPGQPPAGAPAGPPPQPRQQGEQHDADRRAAQAATAPELGPDGQPVDPTAPLVPAVEVPAPEPTPTPPAPTTAPTLAQALAAHATPYPAVRGALPQGNVEWPPRSLRPALERMTTWDAWWSGDVDQLAAAYGSRTGSGGAHLRPSQYAGGVVGALSRFWWGKTPAAGEQPAKLHVPLGADICRTSADLLFAEPITAWCPDPTSAAMLDDLLDEGLHSRLLESAELAAALGGVYLVPGHNREIDPGGHAWIDAVPPDQAWPEWVGGRLAAVTLWRLVDETEDRSIVYRHLERHVPGYTVHGLYAGDAMRLGRPVPLTEHAATAHLAEFVGPQGEIATGWPGLAAEYVPNYRPNPLWRRDPVLAPLGRPDLHGIEGLLDALDETYSDWMRDVRLAKGRIIVPESYLQAGARGSAPTFDLDREAYSALPGILDEGQGSSLTLAQFAIRVQEHADTADALKAAAVEGAGYDPATFGIVDSGQAITATEVKSRQRRTFTTRDRKIAYWTPALRRILPAVACLDAVVYGRPRPILDGFEVEFPDGVSDDLRTLGETADVLARAKAASTDTLVRLVHPDWDDAQVQAEVDRIGEQSAPPIELLGPGMFPGDPTQALPGDDPEGLDEGDDPEPDDGPPSGPPTPPPAPAGAPIPPPPGGPARKAAA